MRSKNEFSTKLDHARHVVRSGNGFECHFDVNGRTLIERFATEDEAKQWGFGVYSDLLLGKQVGPPTTKVITIGELCRQSYERHWRKQRSAATARGQLASISSGLGEE